MREAATPGEGLLRSKFRCNTKDLGSVCCVNNTQSSELSLHMSPSNKTKFTHNIQKASYKTAFLVSPPLFFFSSTCVTSSHSRQTVGLRATTSKWHFDISASRIREHTTNLVNILGTIHITSLENYLSVCKFIRLLVSFLSYYTCITIRELYLSAESLLKNKSIQKICILSTRRDLGNRFKVKKANKYVSSRERQNKILFKIL